MKTLSKHRLLKATLMRTLLKIELKLITISSNVFIKSLLSSYNHRNHTKINKIKFNHRKKI